MGAVVCAANCESLAGWGLSQERLAIAEQRMRVRGWFAQAGVDVIASSHSCLPAMVDFATPRGVCVAVNNGAAGMPNFRNTRHGVITRIATRPAVNPQPLYATRVNDLHVEALPVHYDHDRWQREFLANWPPGSPAYLSYHTRITRGPAYAPAQALRLSATPAIGRRPIAIRDRRDFG